MGLISSLLSSRHGYGADLYDGSRDGHDHGARVLPLGVRWGDAISLLGWRGTGKTTLAQRLYDSLLEFNHDAVGYVIDSNAGGDFTGWSGGFFGFEPPIIGPTASGRQLVWQPPHDDPNAYEDFFGRLFEGTQQHGVPCVVLLDELSCLGGGDNHHEYSRILKRGRARDNFPGITIISISQELAQRAKVPRQTFSQMNMFIKFYVQNVYDLLTSNQILHLPTGQQPEHKHGFYVARMDSVPIKSRYYRGMEQAGL